MDTLRAQLLRIQQQLSSLSASQKMLTASLVAIMIMTLIWWGRYAGTAEMEPVLDQSFSAAEQGQIKQALDAKGITAKIVGDRVMVSSDRKLEALAALAYAEAIPANASNAWDEMLKQMSPWDSKTKTDSIQNHMRERMLAEVMSGFFPGVSKASVIVNPVSERHVGGNIEPTASVQLTTRHNGDANVKRLADAAASTVASAVPGLKPSRVSVVIDGIPRRAHDSSAEFVGADAYEQTLEFEKYTQQKIVELLPPGTLVAVKAEVETSSSQQTSEIYDAQKTVSKEKSIETESTETSQPAPASAEPGAVSNMSLSLQQAPVAGGASSTTEKNRTEMQVFPSKTVETVNKPAGKTTVASAAVRMPRSYFVERYKLNNPNAGAAGAKEPDDTALQPLVTAELPTVRKVVQAIAAIKSDDAVSVDMYYDSGLPMLAGVNGAGGGAEAGGANVASLMSGHVKEIAVGALAVISLFMVSMIVRKGTPAPIVTRQAPARDTPRIASVEELAGIVGGESPATLDAVELDDDAIRAQQMVEQVSTMVKEDPDSAANLVKRWLNQTR